MCNGAWLINKIKKNTVQCICSLTVLCHKVSSEGHVTYHLPYSDLQNASAVCQSTYHPLIYLLIYLTYPPTHPPHQHNKLYISLSLSLSLSFLPHLIMAQLFCITKKYASEPFLNRKWLHLLNLHHPTLKS